VRYFYQTKGYFKALVGDPKTQIHDTSGVRWYFPSSRSRQGRGHHHAGGRGQRYRLKEITFTGNKAVKNTQALRNLFKIKDGDVFDTEPSARVWKHCARLCRTGLYQLHSRAQY